MISKTINVGGGKITMSEDFWLMVEGEKKASVWLSIDDAENVAEMLTAFARMAELPDTRK